MYVLILGYSRDKPVKCIIMNSYICEIIKKIGSNENKWTLTKIITLCRKCEGLRKVCRRKSYHKL